MTPLLVVLFLIVLGVGIVALAIGLIDAWRREAQRAGRKGDLIQRPSSSSTASSAPESAPFSPGSAASTPADPFAHIDVQPEHRL